MISAKSIKYSLKFRHPSGTSRGILQQKDSWFIILKESQTGKTGVGECSIIQGLSSDDPVTFETVLKDTCRAIVEKRYDPEEVKEYPSIRFGAETALTDLHAETARILHPSDFTSGKKGIPINGLIWMGTSDEMLERVKEKIEAGFRILKFKVGAIDFEEEIKLIKKVRQEYGISELEIRLDANGAWTMEEALEKMNRLAEHGIHSLEQPISSGQFEEMADVCDQSPIPIALDEELIGLNTPDQKHTLLRIVRPHYIILKPSLLGGLKESEEWIENARSMKIGWWVTSALESNIGLNSIAQWAATLETEMAQGLGTGSLFSNNIDSPLEMKGDRLYYLPENKWELVNLGIDEY